MVSGDDVDFAVGEAIDRGSPDETIDRIMAAVHDPALRGAEFSVAYALVAVSELQLRFGRGPEAEATLRLGVSEDVRDELVVELRAHLAALLARAGRPEEAAREFARLEEQGRAGAQEHLVYGDALADTGDVEGALRGYQAGERLAREPALAAQLRKSADRARSSASEAAADRRPAGGVPSVLFWRRVDHTRAVAAWPTLKDDLGADWDEHRTLVERALARAAEPTYAVADFDSFAAHTRGLPPIGTTLSAYRRMSAVSGTWPPEGAATCWCGSGKKYKRCCRLRGIGAG
ncbi:hypothetical protein BU204_13275 [Actinophytocola xanthii]|uniref:SEC-C motif-containing protein n=1 Tax=Actinophytocola xanthii TaxID=1912961 RepID=A0A1Q8CRT2_9PSEU|nr:hypothetical protein BU204_13275 [Actinophytocola xanthii]